MKLFLTLLLFVATIQPSFCIQTTYYFDGGNSVYNSGYTKIRSNRGQVVGKYRTKNNKVYKYSSTGSLQGYYRKDSSGKIRYYER